MVSDCLAAVSQANRVQGLKFLINQDKFEHEKSQ